METREGLRAETGSTHDSLDRERIQSLVRDRFACVAQRVERIPAGLGDRRFYRVHLGSTSASTSASTSSSTSEVDRSASDVPQILIARVEPQPSDPSPLVTPFTWLPEPPLEPIRTILEDSGLPVPRSYRHDSLQGIDLLEDLGPKTLADLSGEEQRLHYLEACALIAGIQAVQPPAEGIPAFQRVLDVDLIRTKAAKVIHWSWPGLLGRATTNDEREAIESGFELIATLLSAAPRRLSHRDFKAENLHLVPRDGGDERLVMIDVQGAFLAPPEYDWVCLLRDLQVVLPEDLVDAARERLFAPISGASDRADAVRRFEAITMVRLSKDLAHVVHAGHSRRDTRRWHEIPRGLELLDQAMGRLEHTFPEARRLCFVMHALTEGAQYSDIPDSRQGT